MALFLMLLFIVGLVWGVCQFIILGKAHDSMIEQERIYESLRDQF